MQEATHMLCAYSRSGNKEKRVTSNAISSLYPLHALPGKCGGDRIGDGCVFSFQLNELNSPQTRFLHTQQYWGTQA